MDDLIRRSDAIKAVEERSFAVRDSYTVKAILRNVPSADRPQGDTVSRRYLLAEIDDLADEFSEVDENGLHSERWCGILDSKGIIVNAPSVSDRPQGEWTNTGVLTVRCSNCKSEFHELEAMNFCPNCGADMRGEKDETD